MAVTTKGFLRKCIVAFVGAAIVGGVINAKRFDGMNEYELAIDGEIMPLTAETSDYSTVATTNSTPETHLRSEAVPTLILHVGPYKTATTSIQWGLDANRELLNTDTAPFRFLGKCDRWNCGPNQNKGTVQLHNFVFNSIWEGENASFEALQRFKTLLDDHRHRNENVIISAEEFCSMIERDSSDFVWEMLKFVMKDWNVRVVVGYRRYYEWLPSKYNQGQKPGTINPRWKILEQTKSFESFLDSLESRPDDEICTTNSLVNKFRRHFEDVRIFNMADTEGHHDVFTRFVCSMIPEARKTCESLTERAGSSHSASILENSSSPIHLYLIAVAARARKLLKKKMGVNEVMAAMEEHQDKLSLSPASDMPWKCIARDREQYILEKSLSLEKELFPEWHALPEVWQAHIKGFEKAVSKKKFCSIDVDEVLSDKRWESFLRTIE